MSAEQKKNSLDSIHILSGLAQELDAPLKTMLKGSQKLIDDYKDRNFEYISYKDFKNIITGLEQMNRQLKRCAETTQKMMSLNRGGSGVPGTPAKINDVVSDTLDLLGQLLGAARIKVVKRLAPSLPLVRLDKVECHQIVNNVLVNAVQAMPGGGTIKVRTFLSSENGTVVLEIEDEGVGITPAHLSKVFEPFFTTKERGVEKSSGLGLSVVYAILQAHGGDVHIQSSLRKGTLVHIDLPVAAGGHQ